jgi:hypothetical protein
METSDPAINTVTSSFFIAIPPMLPKAPGSEIAAARRYVLLYRIWICARLKKPATDFPARA